MAASLETPWRENRRERARALALLHAAGAVLAAAPVVLPHAPGLHLLPLLLLALGAGLSAAVFVALGARLPSAACQWILAIDTVLMSIVLYTAGLPAAEPYAAFFITLAVFAFHFFRRISAIAHVTAMALGFAVALGAGTSDMRWITPWAVVTVTALMAGGVVGSLSRKARRFARADALTGLANRIAWEESVGREVARAERDGTPLCVAIFDLDHFKVCNDRDGHAAGDLVLREAARAWRPKLRPTDLLARWGGDEFALLLPNCPLDGAVAVVERLRQAMPVGLTFSAGIADWHPGEPNAELAIRRADRELYGAKRAGRDRIAVAS